MRTIRVFVLVVLAAGTCALPACGDDGGGGGTDSDTDADTDADTDVDADTDTDSDTDADTDSDTDTEANACVDSLGGSCVGLVAGCANCGEGSLVSSEDAGCPADTWCCVPWEAASNPCEEAGGVCIPVVPDVYCPTGWESVGTSCGGVGSSCCTPADSCV